MHIPISDFITRPEPACAPFATLAIALAAGAALACAVAALLGVLA